MIPKRFYERAVDIINSNDGDEQFHADVNYFMPRVKSHIAERLSATYNARLDQNKARSIFQWLIKTFDLDERIVEALRLCENFAKVKGYNQTIEFLEKCMKIDFFSFNEEHRAKIVFALTEAYIQYGE